MSSRKALLVGINNYKHAQLHCCCNDANDLGALLKDNEVKINGSFENFETAIENNVESRGKMRSLLEDLFSKEEKDIALFYYSGHGYIDAFGGYLVTPDYADHDWGVSLQEVLALANESKCKDRVIILDSCFSGAMGNISTIAQNTTIIKDGVTILTASTKDQSAVAAGNHSLFTSLLLEALSGGAADVLGHVTVGSIYAFIDKALGPREQRPCFKTNVTRFTSLRDVNPRVALDIINTTLGYFPKVDMEFPLDPSFEFTETSVARPENVAKFKNLQKLEGIGLVSPVGEEHMYFAAMNRKSCKLTAIGQHYWKLAKDGKLAEAVEKV